jgi:hypothetical protein
VARPTGTRLRHGVERRLLLNGLEEGGIGETPAADVARIPGRSASRRGALRMDAAPAENWSVAVNPASSTTNAFWTAAERQQFAARGGVASAIATGSQRLG